MAATELNLFDQTTYTLDPASWNPTGVQGADVVAQRFIYALFTPPNSVPGLARSGSPFLDLARQFRVEVDLFAAFSAAYAAAVGAVQAAESDGDPASEKFGQAQLTGVTIDQDSVSITLSIMAADGSRPTSPINIPLDV